MNGSGGVGMAKRRRGLEWVGPVRWAWSTGWIQKGRICGLRVDELSGAGTWMWPKGGVSFTWMELKGRSL